MKNAESELTATSDNPIPPTASVRNLLTADGICLRVAYWMPALPKGIASCGIVVILQGRGEFIEKYFETIAELRSRGFYVVAFDWRGQGGSQRLLRSGNSTGVQPGHVRDFTDYQRDLDTILEDISATLPALPRFALCHSMGGTIMLLRAASKNYAKDFTRIVAAAPMIELSPTVVPLIASAVIGLGRRLGLSRLIIPGGKRIATALRPFNGNRLTSDPTRFQRLRSIIAHAPQLAVGDPTVGWLAAAFRAMKQLAAPRCALLVATPALVLAAGGDRVISTPAIERFCARLKIGNAIIIPYSKHEILMENDDIRGIFWAAFDAFIPGKGLVHDNEDQPTSKASASS